MVGLCKKQTNLKFLHEPEMQEYYLSCLQEYYLVFFTISFPGRTFYCNVKAAFPHSVDEVLSSSLLLLAVADYCFSEVFLSEPELLSENGRNAFKLVCYSISILSANHIIKT